MGDHDFYSDFGPVPERDDDALVMPSMQAHLPKKSPVIAPDREAHSA